MNITLIGMSGVGKSLFGEKLAAKLGYRFVDVDLVIEKKQGMKLQKVLDRLGDSKFIEMEGKTILSLKGEGMVFAPGGSVVYSKGAMEYLKKISKIIYLKDKPEIIKERTKNLDCRGIVGLKNKTFEALFAEREKLYEKYADFVVRIDNFNPEVVVERILQTIKLS